ncbi:hypothetical protein V1514DRAFT_342063 [Lipomyces japonicus]|uniref:uncharacterized protein n=1 Tax=Lipomyces japonicus TaxID=56871 RepID=UPI0034CF6C89
MKSDGSSRLNLSVLCPSCGTTIALDFPFLTIPEEYSGVQEPESSSDDDDDDDDDKDDSNEDNNDNEAEEEEKGEEHDDDGGQDESNKEGLDFYQTQEPRRNLKTRQKTRLQHIIKELEKKVEQLSTRAANEAGRASNLQNQLDRLKRKSSMARLSSQVSGVLAPPQISQMTSSPVLSTPSRRVSNSSLDQHYGTGTLSHSQSHSSLYQFHQQQQQQQQHNQHQMQQQQQQQQAQGFLGGFSLARTVSYIPFSSAILATSSSFFPGTSSPLQTSSAGVLSTSFSSSSTVSSNTISDSGASLSSFSIPPSPPGTSDSILTQLQSSVHKERKLREEAEDKFNKISVEVEELSQSLFEQANEMVAKERRQRAKVEGQVKDANEREQKLNDQLSTLQDAFNRIVVLSQGFNNDYANLDNKTVALKIEQIALDLKSKP